MKFANRNRLTSIPGSRRGFTLIEMLVVMAIIIALAAITLLFLGKNESKLALTGANNLQTWLASARSRALRDQTPTGIRLLPAGNGPYTSVQLIQTPEPLAPGAGSAGLTMVVQKAGTTALFSGSLPTPVQAGDMLEIVYGVGSIHRVTAATSTSVTLASVPPAAAQAQLTLSAPNAAYRFIRQPLPLMGEPAMELPNTVFICGNTGSGNAPASVNLPWNYAGTSVDIIFGPSGQVINATSGRIVLAVGDTNSVSKPMLVTIYARTGAVAIHPVDSSGGYSYTQDGLSSGQ